ncbi:hypothetical protein BO71DRAFT_327710, partial [Aspergillus ellipticus CBS 707.79]
RKEWPELFVGRKPRPNIIVPAVDLEAKEFTRDPHLWASLFRVILDDPTTECLSISGICQGSPHGVYNNCVLTNPNQARIWGKCTRGNRWNRTYLWGQLHMPDQNKMLGHRIGHPIHAHCWLMLDQMIGHRLAVENLQALTEAIRRAWKSIFTQAIEKSDERFFWMVQGHYSVTDLGDMVLRHWYRPTIERKPIPWGTWDEMRDRRDRRDRPGNPFKIPEIQSLIAGASQTKTEDKRPNPHHNSNTICNPPLEIAMMIVDKIYERPLCHETLNNVPNVMDALQWKLPLSYWVWRCNPHIFYEVDNLLKERKEVDWQSLCFGLHELVLNEDLCYTSGLNIRCQALTSLFYIKRQFLFELERNKK